MCVACACVSVSVCVCVCMCVVISLFISLISTIIYTNCSIQQQDMYILLLFHACCAVCITCALSFLHNTSLRLTGCGKAVLISALFAFLLHYCNQRKQVQSHLDADLYDLSVVLLC